MFDGVNFAKDYQKDSYNQKTFIEKNINDKNILATLKKHTLLRLWNSKTLKIQKCFKIALEFQSLKILLPHINGL
jgi:hypothetical protein